ncbi:MAG: hypothetical protein JWM18_3692 [Chloroflexi bacterium]|jgi:hypothetical protein|nr:hypothetical protein [Chloroflexota bacterium]
MALETPVASEIQGRPTYAVDLHAHPSVPTGHHQAAVS